MNMGPFATCSKWRGNRARVSVTVRGSRAEQQRAGVRVGGKTHKTQHRAPGPHTTDNEEELKSWRTHLLVEVALGELDHLATREARHRAHREAGRRESYRETRLEGPHVCRITARAG